MAWSGGMEAVGQLNAALNRLQYELGDAGAYQALIADVEAAVAKALAPAAAATPTASQRAERRREFLLHDQPAGCASVRAVLLARIRSQLQEPTPVAARPQPLSAGASSSPSPAGSGGTAASPAEELTQRWQTETEDGSVGASPAGSIGASSAGSIGASPAVGLDASLQEIEQLFGGNSEAQRVAEKPTPPSNYLGLRNQTAAAAADDSVGTVEMSPECSERSPAMSAAVDMSAGKSPELGYGQPLDSTQGSTPSAMSDLSPVLASSGKVAKWLGGRQSGASTVRSLNLELESEGGSAKSPRPAPLSLSLDANETQMLTYEPSQLLTGTFSPVDAGGFSQQASPGPSPVEFRKKRGKRQAQQQQQSQLEIKPLANSQATNALRGRKTQLSFTSAPVSHGPRRLREAARVGCCEHCTKEKATLRKQTCKPALWLCVDCEKIGGLMPIRSARFLKSVYSSCRGCSSRSNSFCPHHRKMFREKLWNLEFSSGRLANNDR